MAAEPLGILGSGDVGRALGSGLARHGRDVLVGTRHPEQLVDWKANVEAANPTGSVAVGSFAEAADHGDIVVLAVRGEATIDVLDLAGTDCFAETLVLDATNPLDLAEGFPPALLFGGTDSLGERVQGHLPDAQVVKCFNTVSHNQMVDPSFEAETPSMLICGDHDGAKDRTERLLVDLGWPGALDVGDITAARYLEALVPLWARIGGLLGTYDHAFAVVE